MKEVAEIQLHASMHHAEKDLELVKVESPIFARAENEYKATMMYSDQYRYRALDTCVKA
ncbi:hypothetical protein PHLCEN_2v13137 [Hermanssonia centrifuga]|uniref:Uncharacterized protein n=1 Tax=Hermanssonia centrifuga TaxID=98765 RepID=A0A2R6NF69_9APHY|nr:hypothetical protein PHLCEN_2v13137 [Hermanssonia centrifuga]